MELLFIALCLFFILLWWVPSAVNSITASRSKGVPSVLDEEVATDVEPDVFSDFHRRLSQRFVVRAEGDQVLTDEAVASLIAQLPDSERKKIREVRLYYRGRFAQLHVCLL